MEVDTGEGEAPIRLGIVGLGWISPWHGQAANDAAGVKLAACCDINESRVSEFRTRYGCDAGYTDLATMLREHELDAVVLATWPAQHLEQIQACLEAGIQNILCEKSLAYGTEMALEIWKRVNSAGALLTEAFMWRHHPAVIKVDELLAAGEIGQLDYINASFDEFDFQDVAPDDPNRDWRKRPESAGGAPWDMTCYCIDASNHFAGALPARAMAYTSTSERYGTIDRVHGIVEYENGRVAHIASSLRTNFNYEVKLNGADGTLVIPNAWRIDDASELLLSREGEQFFTWSTTKFQIPKADPYLAQLTRFAAAIRGEASPYPALSESILDTLTLDALIASGANREPVAIEVPSDVRAAHEKAVFAA